MALSDIDRELLRRCLENEATAWQTFVDRFLGLVTYVVQHTATSAGIPLSTADQEDVIAEVFFTVLENDKQVLRRFQGRSSLATYLTVIARRVAVRKLLKRLAHSPLSEVAHEVESGEGEAHLRIDDQDQVSQMLGGLGDSEAKAVRMYHLEGKNYQEISTVVGMPVNSIGPLLSRARTRLRLDAGAQ